MVRHTWASSLVAAEIAVVVGLSVLFSIANPTTSVHVGKFVLCTLAVAILLAVVMLRIGIARERPRLRMGLPLMQHQAIPGKGGGNDRPHTGASVGLIPESTPSSTPVDIWYLHIWNDPPNGSRTAEAVHLQLRFLREGSSVQQIPARWSHTPTDVGIESTQVPSQLDIPANGVQYMVDILARFPGHGQIYAVNDAVQFSGWESYPLGTEPLVLEVTARGANVRGTTRWKVTPSQDTIDFAEIKDPGRFGRRALVAAKWVERKWGGPSMTPS